MTWSICSHDLALSWMGYVQSAFSLPGEIEAISGLRLTAWL